MFKTKIDQMNDVFNTEDQMFYLSMEDDNEVTRSERILLQILLAIEEHPELKDRYQEDLDYYTGIAKWENKKKKTS